MAVNFSVALYQLTQDMFGRPITVTPLKSQPGAPAYAARGIYDSGDVNIMSDIGAMAVISDQETILDIRDDEFAVIPVQGDIIEIPAHQGILVGVGTYEVIDAGHNGGGETTLSIRKLVPDVNPLTGL